MEQASGKLTVFFDPSFWVGVFERIEDGKLTVSKVTFGAEPKDYEVYDFILHHYYEFKFSPPALTEHPVSDSMISSTSAMVQPFLTTLYISSG